MSVDLKGRTALVTGSTSGIAEASAVALAARGAHVLVVGRNAERAEQVVAAIEGGPPSTARAVFGSTPLPPARPALG
jgi:NAD(P)-dependent dehydrogenase (short-subunit alcohol dehydrogenase family)